MLAVSSEPEHADEPTSGHVDVDTNKTVDQVERVREKEEDLPRVRE